MKHFLEVCLVAAALSPAVPFSVAQQSALTPTQVSPLLQVGITTPVLKKGISVKMPVTTNAISVPKADEENSLVVTVTRDGNLYLGASPIAVGDLGKKVARSLSSRTDKTVYIKADARTSYASVVKVLDCLRTTGVERLTLLTAQPNGEQAGQPVPPKGLELLVDTE